MNDLLLHTDGDLAIQGADVAVVESTLQHQRSLLMQNKGEWVMAPLQGVGIERYTNDDDSGGLLAEVKSEFEKDGMTVELIELENDKLNIHASYR